MTPEKQSPHTLNRKGPRGCPRELRGGFQPSLQEQANPGTSDPSKSPAMGKASDMPPGVLLWIILEGCMGLPGDPWSYSRFWQGHRWIDILTTLQLIKFPLVPQHSAPYPCLATEKEKPVSQDRARVPLCLLLSAGRIQFRVLVTEA